MTLISEIQTERIDVSIIIPVYNAAETIGHLISKILRETRVVIELIIVNDGSTDATGNLIRDVCDNRFILIEQENQGVYAARNAALDIHRGEWVIFLDADDDVKDGFIYERWQDAINTQADVMIFNAWRTGPSSSKTAVHVKQPYGKNLSGHDWIRHCVTHREWPHYLWLQIIRSSYIRQHSLSFQSGKSHKDILWTIHLAAANGRFCLSDSKDYTYKVNADSITHRSDYFDVRAQSYIEVIAEIIRLARLEQNIRIRVFLYRHALVEARHFLGLFRNNVGDKIGVKSCFRESISAGDLFKGINSLSDVFFFIKLSGKLL
ncbi:glycosyltransferase [Rahnella sp. PAMC25617]|jgi:glycosyltransferase involved in cell wall biosynthesis|uniref:glycosyltransferase n=1 Tax=Rahnella sp. PAMC25617 TaxID=3399684 RepID=UPI000DE89E4C|nr:glycosyltransferase [Rahnella aquatilis]RBQ35625.1 glycosyl transferase [Rahnella aquatilis]